MKRFQWSCLLCGFEEPDLTILRCRDCEGALDAVYDLEQVAIRDDVSPLHRYGDLLPLREPGNASWFGEGDTPCVRAHAAMTGPWYHPCGTLLTGSAADRAQAERLGYIVETVDDERVFLPEEGWVDAPLYARSLASTSGASFLSRTVTGLRPGWEVLFDEGSLRVDVVVNTAGNGAARIAAMAGHSLSLVPSLGMLVELLVPGHPLRHTVHTDDVTLRPVSADRLLLRGPSGDANLPSGHSAAEELLRLAAKVVPWLDSASIHDVRIGSRVIPAGGLPSVGAVPGVDGYLHAVAHSGVILAPVIGKQLADLVLA